MKNDLSFLLYTPEGKKAQIECYAVNLNAMDDDFGNGGGSIGIMHGHLPAVIALKNPSDIIIKSENGEQTISVCGGFCEVKNNIITVISEKGAI